MHSDMFADIGDFHQKFQLSGAEPPALLPKETNDYRTLFMHEELTEYTIACDKGDLVEAADALADLIYVALGTAYLMGIPMNDVWNAVHAANMTKRRVDKLENSKRSSLLDVVKPDNFTPPQARIKELLEELGWTAPQSPT